MNCSLGALCNWLNAESPLFLSFHKQVEFLGRMPNETGWDQQREAAESAINPFCFRELNFAALSLDRLGMTYYGQYSVTLKSLTIEDRASVFEQNPFVFNQVHHVVAGQKPPCGYRATWPGRAKLAVAKLHPALEPGSSPASFALVLMEPRRSASDCDFMEVHIFGPINRAGIERIIGPEPKTRQDRALWKQASRKARALGAEVETVTVRALISGQAAAAVIRDQRVTLRTLDGASTEAWHSGDILRVFDGCVDVKEVSVSAVEEVDALLRTAWAADRALKLFLLLLDPAEPREELAEYAACVEELLAKHELLERLEERLLAATLPISADIVRVEQACTSSPTVLGVFRRILKLQPIIRRVRNSFDVLPTAQFGTEQAKVDCRERLVNEGVFRDAVLMLACGENIRSLMSRLVSCHHDYSFAMRQWIANLRPARKPSLSRHLRDARIQRGLSVAEVAERAGVSVASIYLWETGRDSSSGRQPVGAVQGPEAADPHHKGDR